MDRSGSGSPTKVWKVSDIEKVCNGAPAKEDILPKQASLEADLTASQRRTRELTRDLGRFERLVDAVRLEVVACKQPVFPKVISKKGKSEASALLFLSDWHLGEVISGYETSGFGEFDMAVAKERLQRLVANFTRYIEGQRSLYTLDELVIGALGDFVSGTIHPELIEQAEFPVTRQALMAASLLAETIRRLREVFPVVRVEAVVPDNHGRLELKPRAKGRADHNWNIIVYEHADEKLRDCDIDFRIHARTQELVSVQGKKFLMLHGDTIRRNVAYSNIGTFRLSAMEAMMRMGDETKAYDYIAFGHFHTPGFYCFSKQPIIQNGSLTGTSEYEKNAGWHAPPCQLSVLVHPKYGAFNWVPWMLS